MAHPLGEAVLLVADADPAQLAELAAELAKRDVATRQVPYATAAAELAGGARFLVHCGGQATLVRWLPAAVGTEAVIGVFPGGAPNDFARTFGLETNAVAAAILLASDRTLRVDVGVVRCGAAEAYAFNDAVVGLGADVVRRARRTRLGRLAAWYVAMLRHRRTRYDVDMTFAEWHADAVQIRLSNGQWSLGGLHAAPMALPDDGAWEVQIWDGPRALPFTLQPAMLRGDHLPHEHVARWRQKRVEVVATPPALVAVDETTVVGRTPATFEIREKALRLKI